MISGYPSGFTRQSHREKECVNDLTHSHPRIARSWTTKTQLGCKHSQGITMITQRGLVAFCKPWQAGKEFRTASIVRKFSPTTADRLSTALRFSVENSRRLNLFERSAKCGVEFCFFLVRVRHRTDSLRRAYLSGAFFRKENRKDLQAP